MAGFHQKKKKNSFVKHCGWVYGFNYENTIENWVLETENTSNVFSISITHHSKIKNHVMETMIQNSSKQMLIHGTHTI